MVSGHTAHRPGGASQGSYGSAGGQEAQTCTPRAARPATSAMAPDPWLWPRHVELSVCACVYLAEFLLPVQGQAAVCPDREKARRQEGKRRKQEMSSHFRLSSSHAVPILVPISRPEGWKTQPGRSGPGAGSPQAVSSTCHSGCVIIHPEWAGTPSVRGSGGWGMARTFPFVSNRDV